ncbi:three prime repair exonuclease 2-like isoform X1 [Musca domestica]|uniref:Three prime repair exonuclease 2-like n=1 Tax=Musca domestica TaxID=7370 RepID=A0A1I8N3X4_MUSDO|nr:three prime repair exonuclease 2-like isoform X1 [Musca domestica]
MSNGSDEIIKTIAVIDLETNGLPWQQGNTCAITELSIYAFAATCLSGHKEESLLRELDDDLQIVEKIQPPMLPRVLHKITLMINPNKEIHPEAAKISGLTNNLLQREAPFDENTANCLFMFLERLPAPVCFVAHNGWSFDYPVIRYVLQTIDKSMPSSIFCIDSFKAFREFDEKELKINAIKEQLQQMQYNNSTKDSNNCDILASTLVAAENEKRQFALNMYRQIFSQPFTPATRFPKKGVYVLGNFYERVFQQKPMNLHRAEADVEILTKLILHYGLVFLAYAEERKQSFDEVLPLGCRS